MQIYFQRHFRNFGGSYLGTNLDDQLNNFLTFLEQEFNKEEECAKIYLTGVVLMGVFINSTRVKNNTEIS